jgi:putative ABC transport system substrate-binding protein
VEVPRGPEPRVRPAAISRRQVVVGAAGAGLLVGCGRLPWQAEPPARPFRVGWLIFRDADEEAAAYREVFMLGLHDRGYAEDQSVILEERYAGGQYGRVPDLAADLVHLPADVIVAVGEATARPARDATSAIPIVLVYPGDPVADGLVASLARPGANVTGVTFFAEHLGPKQLELLKQTIPNLSRVAVPLEAHLEGVARSVPALQSAAEALGVHLQLLPVREAADIDAAFEAAAREHVGALLLGGAAIFAAHRLRVVELAAEYGLPAMYWGTEFVQAGGLMAYAANLSAQFRRAAYYVDRILKGTKPADLPVEQPMTFDFVVNMKTAQALGITFPNEIMLQVTEVIQ